MSLVFRVGIIRQCCPDRQHHLYGYHRDGRHCHARLAASSTSCDIRDDSLYDLKPCCIGQLFANHQLNHCHGQHV